MDDRFGISKITKTKNKVMLEVLNEVTAELEKPLKERRAIVLFEITRLSDLLFERNSAHVTKK